MKIVSRLKLQGSKLRIPLEENKSLVIPIILLPVFACLIICGCCFGWVIADVTLHTVGILPTYTPSSTPTFTPSQIPTATDTVKPSSTPTSSPTLTPTSAKTPTLPFTNTLGPSPTPTPTYTPIQTQTPHPTTTFTPKPTLPQPTATSQPTAPPLPPTPVNPTFSGDTVDPPWWPCKQGQIKGNTNSMIYHVPSGLFYAKTYENAQCFNTAAEAEASGYRRSQR